MEFNGTQAVPAVVRTTFDVTEPFRTEVKKAFEDAGRLLDDFLKEKRVGFFSITFVPSTEYDHEETEHAASYGDHPYLQYFTPLIINKDGTSVLLDMMYNAIPVDRKFGCDTPQGIADEFKRAYMENLEEKAKEKTTSCCANFFKCCTRAKTA
jgi:hypothetical protein